MLVDGRLRGASRRWSHEGRQTLRNLQRVAKLYVTKSAFAAFLILADRDDLDRLPAAAAPLQPGRDALTIGIPTFFLALAPSNGPWRADRLRRATSRASRSRSAFIVGVGVLASYLFALNDLDVTVRESRTVATTVLVGLGLYLILVLEASGWRRGSAVGSLCLVLGGLYVLALLLPPTRDFFGLAPVEPGDDRHLGRGHRGRRRLPLHGRLHARPGGDAGPSALRLGVDEA